MTTPTELPLALYKAQWDFLMRTGTLLQESGQRWAEFTSRHMSEGLQQARAAGPGEFLQRQAGEAQAIAQEAAQNQATLVAGLSDAMRTWQQASADALGHVNVSVPTPNIPGWGDLLKPFGVSAEPAPKPTGRAGSK